jgi:hypothetical protein
MRAAIFKGPGAVEAGERPDPVISPGIIITPLARDELTVPEARATGG